MSFIDFKRKKKFPLAVGIYFKRKNNFIFTLSRPD